MQREIDRFFSETKDSFLAPYHDTLNGALTKHGRQHGRSEEWDAVLTSVPLCPNYSEFAADTVAVGDPDTNYTPALEAFLPWRKGPFQVGNTFVDTEWRSDWKWQRIVPHISPLPGRQVLDIGCGNGYHLFRMIAAGASMALGVDPTILFNYQFALIQRLSAPNAAYLLPLRGEHLPPFALFDSVFSLGVLYHRKSPLDHLRELMSFMKPGGELILETLIIEGGPDAVLVPENRYAKMANVWFIPSPLLLENMLTRLGFMNARTVDVTKTTSDEQRTTDWMQFQSLHDYLDPDDPAKTIEGYPAPTRAIVMANKPA